MTYQEKLQAKHARQITAKLLTDNKLAELVFDHVPADMPVGTSTLIGRAFMQNDSATVMRLIGELIDKGIQAEAEKLALDEITEEEDEQQKHIDAMAYEADMRRDARREKAWGVA